jgi:saccharopine dehydrogenase-like NADP-dependent oxidoreductase
MRATVFGATGTIGRKVASELARNDDVQHLTLTARDEERLMRLGGLLGSSDRIALETIDLGDVATADLRRATDETDVIVNAAGPGYLYETVVAGAAIEAGTNYVSLNDDVPPQIALEARTGDAASRGSTMVGSAGIGPGLTNLLTARAADGFESIDEIDMAIVSASGDPSGDAAALHFLAMAGSPARYRTEGRMVTDGPLRAPKFVYFPEPVGWVETFLVDHPEIDAATRRWDPSSVTFRFGLSETAAMDAARVAVVLGLVRSHAGRKAFLSLSGPTRPLLEQLPPRGAPWSSVRVDVRGRRNGRTTTVTYGSVDHLANFASALLSYVAIELGAGRVSNPGFHSIDELFQPDDVLRALTARGMRFAQLEPTNF